MRKLTGIFALMLLGLFLTSISAVAQSIDTAAVGRQWNRIRQHVDILELNISTFVLDASNRGITLSWKDGRARRREAWNTKLPASAANVTSVNDGRGCVHLISTKSHPYDGPPEICAPIKLQMELTMSALHEDWENLQELPSGDEDALILLREVQGSVSEEWESTRSMYCLLNPSESYVHLNDELEACTP